MNYLAHAYLSFDQEEVLVGNFIGDFVKGKMIHTFPQRITDGIHLHRAIDKFTDNHPLVKAGQTYLRPKYGRYATVITDIYFDYFLGKNWESYSDLPLDVFVANTFSSIQKYEQLLPERFLGMFEWMRKDNWLIRYSTIAGIKASLTGLSRRTKFESKMDEAHHTLLEREDEFQVIFFAFFEDLETFAREKLIQIQESHGGHQA
ncbi:ACP phosphodiesterase [Algoriphagus halophytocola]|uniref:acyl carrier protein phosphodiesterase n=1 Tax=Algoriphagus halophytocola TaxID=2991499 RepID=UPI0022DDB515|nr:ACP phosphodiesterase [Algoriphagus sp. TR-M9]WBL43830.1 ACP phosphodiesterase [Algoriphagus sp. TR-M9]